MSRARSPATTSAGWSRSPGWPGCMRAAGRRHRRPGQRRPGELQVGHRDGAASARRCCWPSPAGAGWCRCEYRGGGSAGHDPGGGPGSRPGRRQADSARGHRARGDRPAIVALLVVSVLTGHPGPARRPGRGPRSAARARGSSTWWWWTAGWPGHSPRCWSGSRSGRRRPDAVDHPQPDRQSRHPRRDRRGRPVRGARSSPGPGAWIGERRHAGQLLAPAALAGGLLTTALVAGAVLAGRLRRPAAHPRRDRRERARAGRDLLAAHPGGPRRGPVATRWLTGSLAGARLDDVRALLPVVLARRARLRSCWPQTSARCGWAATSPPASE